jgi:N-acylglucosamine 2-epimerase
MERDFKALAAQYKTALLTDVLPFWETHSIDREQGGYYTCLDRSGNVYDTDKFIWLQNRQVWTFSMLCNQLKVETPIVLTGVSSSVSSESVSGVSADRRAAWLAMAGHGARFLADRGRDPDGNWYFSLTRDGAPLTVCAGEW